MSLFRGDASEIYELAGDMSQAGAKAVPALRETMAQAGSAFADQWRDNSRQNFSDDGHAKHYPDSIDSDLVFDLGGVSVDVGPNRAKKQGFLGHILEFGGERSPAYMDGLRALDAMEPRVERQVDAMIGHLLP